MGQQSLYELVEFCHFEDSGKQLTIFSINAYAQRQFILSTTDAILHDIVHHLFVLVVLFRFLALATLNVPCYAFID